MFVTIGASGVVAVEVACGVGVEPVPLPFLLLVAFSDCARRWRRPGFMLVLGDSVPPQYRLHHDYCTMLRLAGHGINVKDGCREDVVATMRVKTAAATPNATNVSTRLLRILVVQASNGQTTTTTNAYWQRSASLNGNHVHCTVQAYHTHEVDKPLL